MYILYNLYIVLILLLCRTLTNALLLWPKTWIERTQTGLSDNKGGSEYDLTRKISNTSD